MLNVNAKAFVPRSLGEPTSAPVNTMYRYYLTLPKQRVCEVSNSKGISSGVHALLANRWLCSSSKGGLGEEPLLFFLASFFDNVENVSYSTVAAIPFSGILLSRSILSLSGVSFAINAINEAPGFLMRVDIPKEYRSDVALLVRAAWDDFFGFFREDNRINSLGYVSSSCGTLISKPNKGTFRHFFFISCVSQGLNAGGLGVEYLMSCPVPFLRVAQVNSVVPFLCSPRTPVGVVISVGEKAKETLLSDGNPNRSFSILFNPFDVSQTLQSFNKYEGLFLQLLKEYCFSDATFIVHVDIQIQNAISTAACPMPVCDLLQFIGNLCDDTASSILGICFSDDTIEETIQLASPNNDGNVCYLNATLQEVLERGCSLDMCSTCFGRIPPYIKRPITPFKYESVRKYMDKWLTMSYEPVVLTRMVFATAADNFAKVKYYVRNRTIGEKILLATDSCGDVFAADVRTGSIFALPNCFSEVGTLVTNTIFEATIASSFRRYLECVIVLEDILSFEGKDVRETSFSDRWNYVEKMMLDDHTSRPHANTAHIVAIRTSYLSYDRTEQLLKNSFMEYPTLGLVFVPHFSKTSSGAVATYSWVPPESITARFLVGKVDDIPGTNEVKRAWLEVKDKNNEFVSYNDEYAYFLPDAYQLLKYFSVVECVLRRSNDGAHWWELLKQYDLHHGRAVHTYDYVDNLVHVPGLTHDEMLWLLKAHIFKCERCQVVSDIGKTNAQFQAYWCQKCWEETGHGECVYCGRSCAVGKIDTFSRYFYCDNCWDIFSTTNTNADIGYLIPPLPNASFATQAMTRCVSLLVDTINPKAPTNDVLEICCGGAVTRKWIKNKTTRYVGFDLKSSVVEATTEIISSLKHELPEVASYNIICADAFSTDLWTRHITKIHPQQFHTITAFAGLHYAFDTETKVRHVVGSIANALVPRGVFIGCFLDASTLYARGEGSNDLFAVDWDVDFQPRNGHTFLFSLHNEPKKKINVIASDFFVAIAHDYGLSVIPEACLTFLEILENDPSFTKSFSKSEKEYLSAMRTFAFRKKGGPYNHITHKANGKKEGE